MFLGERGRREIDFGSILYKLGLNLKNLAPHR